MTATRATDHAVDVIDLDDPRAGDAFLAGSKGAGLARLRATGFRVPDGVVLPVGIATIWPDGSAPAALVSAVTELCERLGGPLAVRTSATWEDGATTAHAGATATVLGVSGVDDTLAAVRHCLDASADAAREHGTTGDIAIVVQQLVPAEWAGVAFTADPVTGERDIVRIAATAGLGEALVQGDVIGSDLTVRGDAVEGDLGALPPGIATEVASIAREVEAAFGSPQDIEWAVAGGVVSLVQARPITVLPVRTDLPEGNNWQKDTAHYPEPMTPFGWSLLWACDDAIRSVFDDVGMLIRGLDQVFVGGEIYGRVLPAFGDANGVGKPPPPFVLGIAARLVAELRRRTARARRVLARDQMQRWIDDWHEHDRATLAARAAELAAVELGSLDDTELAAHLDSSVTLLEDGQRVHFRIVMVWARRIHALHTLVGSELGWNDPEIASLLGGHSPATRAADDGLAAIRAAVGRNPDTVSALASRPGQPIEALTTVDPELAGRVAAWVAEHAWASTNYDAGVPVLAERPRTITQLLLVDPAPADHTAGELAADRARRALGSKRAEFDRVLAAARTVYPLRDDTNAIGGDRPLALARLAMLEAGRRLAIGRAIPAPDDAAYLTVDEITRALRGVPEPDLPDRVATRRGEEAWTRANPGPAHIGEQGEPPDTSRLPRALREVNEPVLWVVGHEYPAPVDAPDDTDVLLAGIPASAGLAEGPVRVIHGHDDMDRLVDGDVLVCQVTSPAWAPLFALASAIVADGGGALSHAAISAREHGVPAVLGTGNGTSTLTDGQRVRVDGTRGLVFAVESPDDAEPLDR